MKSKFSIVQIAALFFSILFTTLDGMFLYQRYHEKTNMIDSEYSVTLFELVTKNRAAVNCLAILVLFYISTALMLIYLIINLFSNNSFFQNKLIISLPCISLILYLILVSIYANYIDYTCDGDWSYYTISYKIDYLVFVELIMLAIVIGLEIYKQLKCQTSDENSTPSCNANAFETSAYQNHLDEIKKYKDLLDNGIITQEEFDAKKNQLLDL